jgi:phospholipase C
MHGRWLRAWLRVWRTPALGPLGSLFLGVACLGCNSEVEEPPPPAVVPGPEEWNREVVPPSDEQASTTRAACGYAAGALPAETQGASFPSGANIPVDTIVVVMMENRSFDHYFQKLPEYGQPDVDVAPDDFTNPDPDGMPVGIFRESQYCFVDTAHGYDSSHDQVNGGAMDGFVTTNEGNHELPAHGTLDMLSGDRAMGYYDQNDLPFYYWLANTFAIGDRYHSSVLGPTWPNRMYLFAATSFGLQSNELTSADKTIVDYLELRQVPWKLYFSTTPTYGMFIDKYLALPPGRAVPFEQYFADAAAGTLPPVAFVEPGVARVGIDTTDEHPPAIMQFGQRWAAEVVDALTKSPQWPRAAMFLTYDEHGGLYDHVVPPAACAPDDLAVGDPPPTFDHLGIRVPFIVVSPFAKPHYVSHQVYDHTSITRFIEARFVMPAMTARDANALAPWDMFDFESASFAVPPAVTLPEIDQEKVNACRAIFER